MPVFHLKTVLKNCRYRGIVSNKELLCDKEQHPKKGGGDRGRNAISTQESPPPLRSKGIVLMHRKKALRHMLNTESWRLSETTVMLVNPGRTSRDVRHFDR